MPNRKTPAPAGKLDYKKAYPDLYLPKRTPALIEVPSMNFLSIKGQGAPEGEAYQQAVQILYTLSYTIKMSKLDRDHRIPGYIEYVVPPLEGLWGSVNEDFLPQRELWSWNSLIRQPDFVNEQVLCWACEQAEKKHPGLDLSKVRLIRFTEGLCVQAMHQGPYAEERRTIAAIRAFITENGLVDRCGEDGLHHEIYLSDPRRTKEENLRTVLRHPVRRS